MSKKMKTINSFDSFNCICSAKNDTKIHLKLTPEKFKCILFNYKKYTRKRNMWDMFDAKYKNSIERNIAYPTETIEKLKLLKTNYDDSSDGFIGDKCFKLYITHANINDFQKYIELKCCSEFVGFINMHVYNEDFTNSIKHASNVYDNIKTCNF